MTRLITIAQAFAQFQELAETIPSDDTVALCEAWNNYTDSLCKDGALTGLQYHYCPAYGDSMPGDDMESDIEFILEAMGVSFRAGPIDKRSDGLCSDMARHWFYAFERGQAGQNINGEYSQGSAHTSPPTDIDVLGCLLSDMVEDKEFRESDFEYWADSFGYDIDSRKAESIYRATIAQSNQMRDFFSAQEIESLTELFNEAGL